MSKFAENMSSKKILVFSSSRSGNSGFLEPVLPGVQNFLGNQPAQIAFIPFASVNKNYTEYLEMVKQAFAKTPYQIELLTRSNAKRLLQQAEVIMTGGGNTFKLLHDLYQYKLMDLLKERVNGGVAYIGWSAGSNIVSPTIGTTNDMPIIEPKSHKGLGFLPFQINPHYFDLKIEGFNGETRDQRLQEFTRMNPGIPIAALREGTALQLLGGKLTYIGHESSVLYYFANADDAERREITPGQDLSFLLL